VKKKRVPKEVKDLAAAMTFRLPGVEAIVDGQSLAKHLTKSLRGWFNRGVRIFNESLDVDRRVYYNLRGLAAQGDADATRAVKHFEEMCPWAIEQFAQRKKTRSIPKARLVFGSVGNGGPVPIGEGLTWTPTHDDVLTWDSRALHTRAMWATKFHAHELNGLPYFTYADCLRLYCESKWGKDHGHEVCGNVIVDVLLRAERDLRKAEYGPSRVKNKAGKRYDKRCTQRGKVNADGRNPHTKPKFPTQENFWQWLLKQTTQKHNHWRRTVASREQQFPDDSTAIGRSMIARIEAGEQLTEAVLLKKPKAEKDRMTGEQWNAYRCASPRVQFKFDEYLDLKPRERAAFRRKHRHLWRDHPSLFSE
jgi:hypothetical protein